MGYSGLPWRYSRLSKNSSITWAVVEAYPYLRWNFGLMSANPNITLDIVESTRENDWDFSMLSSNINITWDIVERNPDNPWDYGLLSANPTVTWDVLEQAPHIPWCISRISQNPSLTWDDVERNLDRQWNFKELSRNPGLLSRTQVSSGMLLRTFLITPGILESLVRILTSVGRSSKAMLTKRGMLLDSVRILILAGILLAAIQEFAGTMQCCHQMRCPSTPSSTRSKHWTNTGSFLMY